MNYKYGLPLVRQSQKSAHLKSGCSIQQAIFCSSSDIIQRNGFNYIDQGQKTFKRYWKSVGLGS